MKRKLMSMALVLAMALSLLPTTALAAKITMEAPPDESTVANYVKAAHLVGAEDEPPSGQLSNPYTVEVISPAKDDQNQSILNAPIKVTAKDLTWHTPQNDETNQDPSYFIGVGILQPDTSKLEVAYNCRWAGPLENPADETVQYTAKPTATYIDDEQNAYDAFYLTSLTGDEFRPDDAATSEKGGKFCITAQYTVKQSNAKSYVVYMVDFTNPTYADVTLNECEVRVPTGCESSVKYLPVNAKLSTLSDKQTIKLTGTKVPQEVVVTMDDGKGNVTPLKKTSSATGYYTYAYDNSTSTGTLTWNKQNTTDKLTGTVTITDATIGEVDVDITKPEATKAPVDATVNKPANTVATAETKWSDKSGETPTTFTSGETYTAEITLTPKDGYKFDDTLASITLDKETINKDATDKAKGTFKVETGGTKLTITKEFEVKAETPTSISKVDVTDPTPDTSKAPDALKKTAVTTDPADATEAAVTWKDSTGKAVTGAEKFTEGKYTATIVLTLKAGSSFAADLAAGAVKVGDTQMTAAAVDKEPTNGQYKITPATATDPSKMTLVKEYTVEAAKDPVDLSTAEITVKSTLTYDKTKTQEPTLEVKVGDTVLTKDTDYSVTYAKAAGKVDGLDPVEPDATEKLPKDAGAYTATITAKDTTKYTGSKTVDFTIAKAEQPAKITDVAGIKSDAAGLDLSTLVTGAEGTVSFALAAGETKAEIDATDKKTLKLKTGAADGDEITVTVTVNADNKAPNYTSIERTIQVTVTDKTPDSTSMTITLNDGEYGTALADPTVSFTATPTPAPAAGAVKYSYSGTTVEYGPSETKPTAAGKYMVSATYEDNTTYYTASKEFKIAPKAVKLEVVVPADGIAYGDEYTPSVKLADGQKLAYEETLEKLLTDKKLDVKYTVPADLNVSGSPHDITAEATSDNYTFTVTKGDLTVKAKSLKDETIEVTVPSMEYTGEALKPTVTVTNNGKTVPADEYEVAYSVETGNTGKLDEESKLPLEAGTYTVTITAKANGNYTGSTTATLTVTPKQNTDTGDDTKPVAVESVSVSPASLTLTKSAASKLTATVTPSDAEDTTVTWSTSDPKIATVADDGTVTAVAKGSATITVTTNDGGKTATCDVTVIESTPDEPAPVDTVTATVEKTTVVADALTESSPDLTPDDIKEVTESAETVQAKEEDLTKAATKTASDVTKELKASGKLAEKVDELKKLLGNDNTITETKGTQAVAVTSLKVTLKAYNPDAGTLEMDIKPVAKVVLTKTGADVSDLDKTPHVVLREDRDVKIETSIDVTVTLPPAFMKKAVDDTGSQKPIFARHLSRYEYPCTRNEDGSVTFTSDHGFSPFEFTTTPNSKAWIGDVGYATLDDALANVKNNQTIRLSDDTIGAGTTNRTDLTGVTIVVGTADDTTPWIGKLIIDGETYDVTNGKVPTVSSKPDPEKPTSSGSGSGSGGGTGVWGGTSTSTPRVSVNSGSHGKVTTSSATPKKGDIVTLTIIPDDGYELDTLSVKSGGQEIDVDIDGNKATFEMPGTSVTVKATFRAVGSEPGYGDEPGSTALPFADVADDFWAHDQIAWAYENGYMNGYNATTFGPSGNVTREQLWMVLARISGENPADMAAARDWAMTNNVSDGSNPKNSISRQQMVTMLYRYAQLNDYNTDGGTALDTYPDANVVQSYATDALSWAVGNGIVNGTNDGRLDPEGTAIRAQFAVILYRFCDTIVK